MNDSNRNTAEFSARRRSRLWFSAAVTVAFIVVGSIWIRNHWSSLTGALELQPGYLWGMALITFLLLVVMGWINQVAATHLGARLAFSRWVAVTVSTSLINLVLPLRAGIPLRAAYLRKCARLSLAHFASVLAGVTIISVIVNAAIGLLLIPWTGMADRTAGRVLGWTLAAVLLAAVAVALVPSRRRSGQPCSRWGTAFLAAHQGWDELRRSGWLVIQVGALSALLIALTAGRLFLAYQAVGHACSPTAALLLAVLASLSTIVSITPAGLGVREAVVATGEAAAGGDPAVGLLAALADRVVATLVVLTLGPVGMTTILRDMARPKSTSIADQREPNRPALKTPQRETDDTQDGDRD